jgi:hypothetical protein
MLVFAAGKGCHLSFYIHSFIRHIIKTVNQVHAATIVEEQGLVVTSTTIDNAVWQGACAQNPVGSHVEKRHVVLADDEQLASIIHALQSEWFVNILNTNDSRPASIDDCQVVVAADGIALAIWGSKDIAETVLLVVE